MLIEIAKQQLRKAGWYEGRKIDITEQIKRLEGLGYEVFDAAKKFMEEFGELSIIDRYKFIDGSISSQHHTTCIKDLFENNKKYDLDFKVGQKTIPIMIICDEITEYISEDGKIYNQRGLDAYNIDEFWNSYYGEDMYFVLLWDDIAKGKPREMGKCSTWDYL